MAQLPTFEVPYGSLEYVKAAMQASVELQDQTPEMRVMPLDWQAAQWVGDAGNERTVRSSSPVDFATLSRTLPHKVYVRFTDTPETPIIEVGTILVTS